MWTPTPTGPEDSMAVDLHRLLLKWQADGIPWCRICRFMARALTLSL